MASHSALLYQFFEKNLLKIFSLKTQGLNQDCCYQIDYDSEISKLQY